MEKITHRFIAKRQTTVALNIEDVRRFLHSGPNHHDDIDDDYTHLEQLENSEDLENGNGNGNGKGKGKGKNRRKLEEEEEQKYTGFLLLRSLEQNEIRDLVAKGISFQLALL